jgi:hypothetical protein
MPIWRNAAHTVQKMGNWRKKTGVTMIAPRAERNHQRDASVCGSRALAGRAMPGFGTAALKKRELFASPGYALI